MPAGRKVLGTVAALMLASAGCTRSTYLNKVSEAENLSRELSRTQQENEALAAENKAQRLKIANLITAAANAEKERDRVAASLASTTQQGERMAEKCRADDNVSRTKLDAQSRTIEEMRRRLADLQVENSRIRQEINALQKTQEEKIGNVARTYEAWLKKTKEEIVKDMKEEIRKGQVTVEESQGVLTVNLVSSILFDPGRVDLSTEGVSVLQKAAPSLMNLKDHMIRVEGHTDNVPVGRTMRERYPTNLELSVARAVTVARHLEAEGVDPRHIAVAGYSQFRPVADNGTPEGMALNRRIEIVLVPRKESPGSPGAVE